MAQACPPPTLTLFMTHTPRTDPTPDHVTTVTRHEGITEIKRDHTTLWHITDPTWMERKLGECPTFVALYRLELCCVRARLTPGEAKRLIIDALRAKNAYTPARARTLARIPEHAHDFSVRVPVLARLPYWWRRWWEALA